MYTESNAIQQINSDDHLIQLWLFNHRSIHTKLAYSGDISQFREFTRKPLREVGLPDLVGFAKSLDKMADTSRSRILSAVKSLLSFGHKVGYLSFDVGEAFQLPSLPDNLAHRIISEGDMASMIDGETNPRNHAMLVLLYASGIRVDELVTLRRRDLIPSGDSGQITVLGKGNKVRSIPLPQTVWEELVALAGTLSGEDLLFPISAVQVWRIVKKAAKRAGIQEEVSPHWLRHAHASHALDNGAPLHLVQATLGHASISTTGRYLHARPKDSSGNYLHYVSINHL